MAKGALCRQMAGQPFLSVNQLESDDSTLDIAAVIQSV